TAHPPRAGAGGGGSCWRCDQSAPGCRHRAQPGARDSTPVNVDNQRDGVFVVLYDAVVQRVPVQRYSHPHPVALTEGRQGYELGPGGCIQQGFAGAGFGLDRNENVFPVSPSWRRGLLGGRLGGTDNRASVDQLCHSTPPAFVRAEQPRDATGARLLPKGAPVASSTAQSAGGQCSADRTAELALLAGRCRNLRGSATSAGQSQQPPR